MGRIADAVPVGPLLALWGLGLVVVAGLRASVAETVDPLLVLALAPVFFAGGALLTLGYRVRTLAGGADRVLLWGVVGAIAIGGTADAVLLRTRAFGAPLDPLLVVLSVAAVAGTAGAIAAFVDARHRNSLEELQGRVGFVEQSLRATRGVALARLDPEGYVDEWSAGAAEITGFEAEDVVGVRVDALYPDDRENAAKEHLQRALKTDPVDLEGEFRRADGGTFHGVGALTAIQADQSLLGYVFVLADRSDEHARREQLERRNAQLEAFASVVSHDLRNPLNVAIGNLGMARQLEDNDEKLATAEQALERMERLIEEVLTLARQGKDVDEFERVELEECVDLAWNSVDSIWAELSHDDLQAVTADGERLRRLLENLFRNAIEHGGEEVHIHVGMLPGDEGFYVEDDGPGIPMHKLDEVFDAGYTTGEDGTGLGLAIVKSIAEAHGWEIEAAQGEAGGARFEVRGVQTLADVDV